MNYSIDWDGPGERDREPSNKRVKELAETILASQETQRLREFVDWVDSWVSNPVGSYSVSALDSLFGMTRDKIAALNKSTVNPSAKGHSDA